MQEPAAQKTPASAEPVAAEPAVPAEPAVRRRTARRAVEAPVRVAPPDQAAPAEREPAGPSATIVTAARIAARSTAIPSRKSAPSLVNASPAAVRAASPRTAAPSSATTACAAARNVRRTIKRAPARRSAVAAIAAAAHALRSIHRVAPMATPAPRAPNAVRGSAVTGCVPVVPTARKTGTYARPTPSAAGASVTSKRERPSASVGNPLRQVSRVAPRLARPVVIASPATEASSPATEEYPNAGAIVAAVPVPPTAVACSSASPPADAAPPAKSVEPMPIAAVLAAFKTKRVPAIAASRAPATRWDVATTATPAAPRARSASWP
jgi:hypothetical protein